MKPVRYIPKYTVLSKPAGREERRKLTVHLTNRQTFTTDYTSTRGTIYEVDGRTRTDEEKNRRRTVEK